ncbi:MULTISPECIES: DMT family transporter [Candidatus Microthrix]|uniref:DMT family transporter n=1 Tax=Candidatus Neomicrothrix parvicella TaxID=41950 RepID=UPI00138AE78D|nr:MULTISPECIES: EamA family transporter [Microthrix]MBK7018429.1 EamA family transporter [Candidatus Microthrix sp.]
MNQRSHGSDGHGGSGHGGSGHGGSGHGGSGHGGSGHGGSGHSGDGHGGSGHSPGTIGALAVLGAAVLWGTIGPVANGLADRGLSPVTMATWRALVAGVGFSMIWLVQALRARLRGSGGTTGASASPLRRPMVWVRLVTLGLIGVSVFYTALPAAIERGGITLAWVLLYTAPVWVLIGSVMLGWMRPTPRSVTLVLVASGGVALTAAAGGEGVTVSAASVAWGLTAGLSYASYYLVGRTLVELLGPIRTYAIAMLIGGLVLVPFADLAWPSWDVAGLLALLSLASTLLAYLLLGAGLTRISSTRASVIATAEPVVATVMAVAVAGERPGAPAIVGGALVVGSALAAGLGSLDPSAPTPGPGAASAL